VEQERPQLQELVPPGAKTQGVVLEAGPLPELSLEALLREIATPAGSRLLVALDGVEDPQNVGAIIRVADGAGVAGLVLTRRHAPPLGPAVARASAGAVEHLPVARAPNLSRAIKDLKKHGFWAIGADAEEGEDIFDVGDKVLSGDLVLILGAEGRGIRAGVGSVLDHRVRVPLAGRVASLNVSAAAAVVLFEVLRRRRQPAAP
jgi:23S rRNA (guanosine2251-2'-O)-methyltransferase